jgi:hypothetical protein
MRAYACLFDGADPTLRHPADFGKKMGAASLSSPFFVPAFSTISNYLFVYLCFFVYPRESGRGQQQQTYRKKQGRTTCAAA